MWHRGKKLPVLICVTAFYSMVALVTAEHMDMAQDAVDDQYKDCRDKMLKKVVDFNLLTEELAVNKIFQDNWNIKAECASEIPGGVKEHTQALMLYGYSSSSFKDAFDQAVKTMGGNASVYESNFNFKSLHFLLSDSMSLLKKSKECLTVYGVRKGSTTASEGSEVRFGTFHTAAADKLDILEDPDLDRGTLFEIKSCYLLNMRKLCDHDGNGFLLSPTEVFKVDKVEAVSNEDYDYTLIKLTHSSFNSSHDCFLFPRLPSDSSTQLLGTIGAVLTAVLLCLFMY